MKTVLKKLIFPTTLIALFISLVVIFSNVNLGNLDNIANETTALALEGDQSEGQGVVVSSHGSHSGGITLGKDTKFNIMHIPEGYICFQHNIHFEYKGEDEAKLLAAKGTYAGTTSKTSSVKDDHADRPTSPRKSNSVYKCTNDHVDVTGAMAYILSGSSYTAETDGYYKWGQTGGTWAAGSDITDALIQAYIWSSDLNIGDPLENENGNVNEDGKGNYNDGGLLDSVIQEAQAYEQYENAVTSADPKISASSTDAKVNINQIEKYFIIGPFTINYVSGGMFAGVSNITSDKGTIVSFIQQGSEKNFVPFKYGSQGTYPESGIPFYLKISGINECGPINVEFEYTYMLAKATICYLEGHYYTLDAQHDDNDYHSHTSRQVKKDTNDIAIEELPGGGNNGGSSGGAKDEYETVYDCTMGWHWQPKKHASQKMGTAWGERRLYKASAQASVTFNIELKGHVWLETLAGKENVGNGLLDQGDIPFPNIEVTLKGTDGDTKVTKTDLSGDYKFTDLKPFNKYIAIFKYNGQYYIPVPKKSDQPNGSKAEESSADRSALNNKFGEIGASPVGYGGNDAYPFYDVMGFELQEDGTYAQTGPQLIDETYVVSDGAIIETDSFHLANISSSSSSGDIGKMLKYISDCQIKAKTDEYPKLDDFVVDDKPMVIPGIGTKDPIYEENYQVHLGLQRREINDLALRKNIYRAAIKINGKTEVYNYNTHSRENSEDYWKIEVRLSDYNSYYGNFYTREIYQEDYNYKSANTNLSGKDLEVYVTYQIIVRNTSTGGITDKITEIVDYYDKDYTFMDKLSWVMYGDGSGSDDESIAIPKKSYYNMIHNENLNEIKNAKNIKSSTSSRYSGSEKSLPGTNTVYIKGLEDKTLNIGEDAYVYLTFKVNSDNKGPVILDDESSLKQNYAEINGYKSFYSGGTVAGLVDWDSMAGNLNGNDVTGSKPEANFEDDTDRATSLKLELINNPRKINGNVWEDERTVNVNGSMIGDGVRQDEIPVQGVTVELVEKISNNKEYVWQTTHTNQDGMYEFSGFIPANYITRFKYGDNDATVLTKENGGANVVSYNGQDFKSTVYSKDLKNGTEILGIDDEYYDIQLEDELSLHQNLNLSDAKDVWNRRNTVNSYSISNVTNHKAEVLASPYADDVNTDLINELKNKTSMVAETPIIIAEVEYDRQESNGLNSDSNGADQYLYDNDYNGNYVVNSVDFGLTERPKAQLELNKKITNIQVTLSNGTVEFDATQSTNNLAWLSGTPYNLDGKMSNNKYNEYYTDNTKNRYSYRDEIDKYIKGLYPSNKNGLLQVIMDNELMHGATIKITYNLTVKNVSEKDYTGKDFYYKGTNANDLVTTSADIVIDYVANNLQYRETDNTDWEVKSANDIISSGLVNNNLNEELHKFNTIIQTSKLDRNLKPGDSITKELVLSETMNPQNTDDDRTYNNITEIVQTSNTVGRRMAYSIVGNQNPSEVPAEVDSSKAEEVIVLPPFGLTQIAYIGIALLVVVILAIGIVLIKKKVINK